MEGHKDPFNRRTYPWGKENPRLLSHYRLLGRLRKEQEALRLGSLEFIQAGDGKMGYARSLNGQRICVYVNLSNEIWTIPGGEVLLGQGLQGVDGQVRLSPLGMCILKEC